MSTAVSSSGIIWISPPFLVLLAFKFQVLIKIQASTFEIFTEFSNLFWQSHDKIGVKVVSSRKWHITIVNLNMVSLTNLIAFSGIIDDTVSTVFG